MFFKIVLHEATLIERIWNSVLARNIVELLWNPKVICRQINLIRFNKQLLDTYVYQARVGTCTYFNP